MKFPKVRDVLNKLKWDSIGYEEQEAGIELDYAILTVKDRVYGTKEISGSRITRLGRREFDVSRDDKLDPPDMSSGSITTIPYYKVIRIVLGDELIWERPKDG